MILSNFHFFTGRRKTKKLAMYTKNFYWFTRRRRRRTTTTTTNKKQLKACAEKYPLLLPAEEQEKRGKDMIQGNCHWFYTKKKKKRELTT